MAKSWIWISLTFYLFFEILISSTLAATDHLDVEAINDLYAKFSYASQLTGWKPEGGDPCEESWKGVSCNGTSIILIELKGLGLSGHLGGSLYLQNLKHLDLSSNYIQGEIPNYLPRNLTHLDLSCNNFSMNIPYSLAFVQHLHHLNLSHNFLSGPVGNLFTAMQNLRRMDLSYNSLAGDLPSSFANLTNLTDLYLQENKFTGSAIFLAHLHLTNLNIENNNFSGVLPKQFQNVPNLWIGGNKFQYGSAGNHKVVQPLTPGKEKKGRLYFAVFGVALVATCFVLMMVLRQKAPYGRETSIFLALKEEAVKERSRIKCYITELSGKTHCHTVLPRCFLTRQTFEADIKEYVLDEVDARITYLQHGVEGEFLEVEWQHFEPQEVYVFPRNYTDQESTEEALACLMEKDKHGVFSSKLHTKIKLSDYQSFDEVELSLKNAFCIESLRRLEWIGLDEVCGGVVSEGEKHRFKIWRVAVSVLQLYV